MICAARVLASACVFAAATRAAAERCPADLGTRLIPLPIYSTLPNEGSTYGFMPVFLRVCDATQRTESIIAPSATWNDVIRATGSYRLYHYPSDIQSLTVVASISSRINSGLLLQWRDLPRESGTYTTEVELRWQRSVFYRFFGFGPDTAADAETSYTRVRAHANLRLGQNLGGDWNAGALLYVHGDAVQDLGVPGLPLSPRVFPDAPGMGGSTTFGQLLDVRYDSRPGGDYSESGVYAGGGFGVVEGVANSPTYVRGYVRLRALFREVSWMSTAVRLDWSGVSSSRAAFYDQSTLGGAYLLRGFTEDRFIDPSAWTLEIEQRSRVFQTHIYGVTADWRVDPFIAVGQVYDGLHEAFSHPRVAGGVGFRAWVRPNVVGRVDVATGGEGLKVYVEIGYPY